MVAIRQVVQHEAGMHEIELGLWQRIGNNVVPPDVKVVMRKTVEETGIKISCHDPTCRANSVAKPTCHGAMASTEFKTPPSGRNANLIEKANRSRIEGRFK